MAEAPRRSKRSVKPKQDSDYEYDEEVLDSLSGRQYLGASFENGSQIVSETATVNCVSENLVTECEELELLVFNYSENIERTVERVKVVSEVKYYQSPVRYEQAANPRASVSEQNINKTSGERRNSSTRLDFLDIEGNFLSADNKSIMSGSGSESGEISEPQGNRLASAAGRSGTQNSVTLDTALAEAVMAALDKMDKVAEEVKSMKVRLETVESNSVRGSVRGSASESESKGKGSSKSKSKGKSKIERVEFERNRQANILIEKLLDRAKAAKENETEAEDSQEDSQDSQPQDLKTMRGSMSKKKKEESRMRAAARLEQAGALGLDGVDSSSSSESGNESEAKKSRKSRRKVKSGAKVKQRSVIRTELWPHTIVNERDGEVTTSEDISQAKFNSGFTYIMATCEEKEESSGRAVLLHALSTMLE